MFSGEEAAQLGVASRVLPAAEVLPAALEMARDIARNVAPLSAALSKRLLWENQWLTREEVESQGDGTAPRRHGAARRHRGGDVLRGTPPAPVAIGGE